MCFFFRSGDGTITGTLDAKQIQKTFAVNTFAHFWTVKTAMPSMKKASEALLVTVSSVMGMTSSARLTDYCASKAAVNAFHEARALSTHVAGCS